MSSTKTVHFHNASGIFEKWKVDFLENSEKFYVTRAMYYTFYLFTNAAILIEESSLSTDRFPLRCLINIWGRTFPSNMLWRHLLQEFLNIDSMSSTENQVALNTQGHSWEY